MIEELIYEDRAVRVLYRRGVGRDLICTFGDAAEAASFNASNYNGKLAIENLNISAIVFQPKSTNWYPSESMHAAINKLRTTIDLSSFRNIVGYGASMGGFGALKFSHFLQATHVIAYCPQWSIDPNEANGANPGFSAYFRKEMSGHGVKGHELAAYGRGIYIIYDPRHSIDNYHARSYLRECDRVIAIPLRGAGHDIPKILIGRVYFSELLRAVVSENKECARNLIVKKYRLSKFRYIGAFRLAIKRHPEWCGRLLIGRACMYLTYDDPVLDWDVELVVGDLIRNLSFGENKSLARSVARLRVLRGIAGDQANMMVDQMSAIDERIFFLRTKFETLICYDDKEREFCARSYNDIVIKGGNPVQLGYHLGRPYLSVGSGKGQKVCVMVRDGKIALREIPDLDGVAVEGYVIEINEERVALRAAANNQYCSISPVGVATWDRSWARSNETFELVRRKENSAF